MSTRGNTILHAQAAMPADEEYFFLFPRPNHSWMMLCSLGSNFQSNTPAKKEN